MKKKNYTAALLILLCMHLASIISAHAAKSGKTAKICMPTANKPAQPFHQSCDTCNSRRAFISSLK